MKTFEIYSEVVLDELSNNLVTGGTIVIISDLPN